jgi:hypothetical protein
LDDTPGRAPVKQILTPKPGLRIEDGTAVVRVQFHRWAEPPVSVDVGANFELEIAFGEIGVMAKDMPSLAEGVAKTIHAFAPDFP